MKARLLIAMSIALAGCPTPEPTWQVVHQDLPGGLVSVWGRSSTDVFAVGADPGDGPEVLHFDGDGWTKLATGQSGDLWWVNGPAAGPVFMGGDGGLLLRYDGTSFTRMETPGTGTVFGIWAAAENDVWAVGGTGASSGFVWRYDGNTWTALEVPELGTRGLFKVWGNSSDDVWICGAMGALYHWDGTALTRFDAGTTRTLFTVHIQGDRAVAVGGSGTAALVEREGKQWVDHSPALTQQLFGVWLTPDDGWTVGVNGTMLRWQEGQWIAQENEFGFIPAFHAVWVDETGGVWAVGGQIIATPLTDGVVVHRGQTIPGGSIEEGS